MAKQAAEIDKLESCFENIIQKMESPFTSPKFLFRLAHEHQKE